MTTKIDLKNQLKKLNRLSAWGSELRKFQDMFQDVYGYSYNATDDDFLIDSIDYDGSMSWDKFIEHMKEIKEV